MTVCTILATFFLIRKDYFKFQIIKIKEIITEKLGYMLFSLSAQLKTWQSGGFDLGSVGGTQRLQSLYLHGF